MATRIGVFFDGTGNNMWNDMAIGDGSQTNIAKLYQLYEDSGYIVRYAEGVGTEALICQPYHASSHKRDTL